MRIGKRYQLKQHRWLLASLCLALFFTPAYAQQIDRNGRQQMQRAGNATRASVVISNDATTEFDSTGKPTYREPVPGSQSVSLVDIGSDPQSPRIITTLPLPVSMFGPPLNLAITPDERLALVAYSSEVRMDGGTWKPMPANKLHVIDLTANPPAHLTTIEVGQRPQGVAISPRGNLALVGNREGKSVSVLSISGNQVRLINTVPMETEIGAVAFTPDGRRALAAKTKQHKIAILNIDGQRVTYDQDSDVASGPSPYNVDVTPDGRLALTADFGINETSDGHVDTVSVIDLEANPPRVIDRVVVNDAPDGMAISPTGRVAVALSLRGSHNAKDKWYYHPNSSLEVLRIEGKRVTKVNQIDLGKVAEGVAFSPDGKYLYIANFLDRDMWVFKVDGLTITDTGKRLQLPSNPTAIRGRSR